MFQLFRVSHGGMGAWGAPLPIPMNFFETPCLPSKPMTPMGCPPPHPLNLKMKPPPSLETSPSLLKSKALFQEIIPRKKTPKNQKLPLILVFHSFNKTGKKMAEIWQKRDFLTWSIQNFVRKEKHFVRK